MEALVIIDKLKVQSVQRLEFLSSVDKVRVFIRKYHTYYFRSNAHGSACCINTIIAERRGGYRLWKRVSQTTNQHK